MNDYDTTWQLRHYRNMIIALMDLLDDVDTLCDATKDDHKGFKVAT